MISPTLLGSIATVIECDGASTRPVRGLRATLATDGNLLIFYDVAERGLYATARVGKSGVGLDLIRLIERATGASLTRYNGKWTAHLVDPVSGASFVHHEEIDGAGAGDSRALLLAVLKLLLYIKEASL